jgi:hypothetical protein
MKKYLPFIVLALGIVLFVGVFVKMRSGGSTQASPEPEEIVAEIPLENRPLTSLTPKPDGHWLSLKIESLNVENAVMLDYELIYKTKQGNTQGVPGNLTFAKGDTVERELLLGSESSGKFRYDEGVEEGTLTLRFRNSAGKLVGKLSTDFHLQTNTSELSSIDGSFKKTLPKLVKGVYFVVMQTFAGGEEYKIFASDGKDYN